MTTTDMTNMNDLKWSTIKYEFEYQSTDTGITHTISYRVKYPYDTSISHQDAFIEDICLDDSLWWKIPTKLKLEAFEEVCGHLERVKTRLGDK